MKIIIIMLTFLLASCSSDQKNAETALNSEGTINNEESVSRGIASVDSADTSSEDIIYEKIEVVDPVLGKIVIESFDSEEPVYAGVKLKISVLCKDQAKVKNTINVPKDEILEKDKAVCDFHGYHFDKEKKIVSISYDLHDSDLDDPKADDNVMCNKKMAQDFDLKLLCEKWAPKK